MKIIVATTHFAKEIKRALRNKSTKFEISAEKQEIIFTGERTIYTPVSPALKTSPSDGGNFDPVQWYQMMQFLLQLEEQPIVIEISGGDEPSFEFMQFIKRF